MATVPLPTSGSFSLQIEGSLGDLLAHLNQLVTDLQAQGIDPTPLKNALVGISLSLDSVTTASFQNINAAINTWKTQVVGTSITVEARIALKAS